MLFNTWEYLMVLVYLKLKYNYQCNGHKQRTIYSNRTELVGSASFARLLLGLLIIITQEEVEALKK